MKNLKYYTLLLLAATLAGCSNELGEPAVNPDYLEPGSAGMQITVGFAQPKGYADVAAGVATGTEKEIKSLALFVKTSHAFAKFYSEDQLFSANGFTQALAEKTPGEKGVYTASIKVRSLKFEGTSEVIAVANYKENNLDFSDVTTIKQLKNKMTEALLADGNLTAPLLMYGDKADVDLQNQETATAVALTMTRLVARLDVVNTAIDADDPTDDFTLTGVRLLNAPSQSALLPEQKQTYAGVNLGERLPRTGSVDPNDPNDDIAPADGETSLKRTYLYETLNSTDGATEATRPTIEVKGIYRGVQVSHKIFFKTADLPGVPGEYFPILRNHLYVLNIKHSEKTNELEFDITVKDWEKGGDILVKPSTDAPTLDNFALSITDEAELTALGLSWDPETTTLTMTQPQAEDDERKITLSFSASAFQAPKCVVKAKDNGKENPADALFITSDDVVPGEVTGYAAAMPLQRSFTLTLPKNVETKVDAGSTNTNYLEIQGGSTDKVTRVTIVYADKRPPLVPEP